jgi:hypothetical protein
VKLLLNLLLATKFVGEKKFTNGHAMVSAVLLNKKKEKKFFDQYCMKKREENICMHIET